MTLQNPRNMLVIELNEAEKHFLDKFVAEKKLPTFEKLLKDGQLIETHIRSGDVTEEKAWRQISPWVVWPSVYTGMPADKHKIIGFRQKTEVLVGQCIWDKLNEKQITTGVFGSLMSYPVRHNPYNLFYFPDAFAETNDCYPRSYKPIQEFFGFIARHYSKPAGVWTALRGLWKLLRGIIKGIPFSTAYEILAQVPREYSRGTPFYRYRALIQAKLQMDIFQLLLQRYQPSFATLHLNHIAYMQHRYWRAAEPESYQDKMGELDLHYYGDIETRKDYEWAFKDAILESFLLTDQFLEDLLKNIKDKNTLLVIATGLGQKKMDPASEIHNPEIRFIHLDRLLRLIDISNCEILTPMNPEITLNFPDAAEASLAAYKLSNLKVMGEYPLFQVKQLEHQLFLDGRIPPEIWFLDSQAWLEDQATEHILPLFDYVQLSRVKDQSTAHHQEQGWLLLYGNSEPMKISADKLDVTDIRDLLLSYFKVDSVKN
jgi:hypothetical protein